MLLFLITGAFLFKQIHTFLNDNQTIHFSPYTFNLTDFDFSKYHDSFNFIISIDHDSFDWKNNPYISATMYELDESTPAPEGRSSFIKSKSVELDYCNGGEVDLSGQPKTFIREEQQYRYTGRNTLCL